MEELKGKLVKLIDESKYKLTPADWGFRPDENGNLHSEKVSCCILGLVLRNNGMIITAESLKERSFSVFAREEAAKLLNITDDVAIKLELGFIEGRYNVDLRQRSPAYLLGRRLYEYAREKNKLAIVW